MKQTKSTQRNCGCLFEQVDFCVGDIDKNSGEIPPELEENEDTLLVLGAAVGVTIEA